MSKFDEKTTLSPKPKFENLAMFLGKQAEDKNAEMWEYWDGSVEGMIKNFYSGNKVKESSLTLRNLMAEILLKGSHQKVNEEQAKAIPTEILQGWEELTKKGRALIIQREQMEAYAQDVINRYELGKKNLDIEEQKLVKDIVLGMLEIASKGAGMALGAKVGKTGFQ